MLSRRKSLWLDLGPGLFSWGQENENTINTHVTQSKCWGIWRAAGHRGGRYQPQGKAGVWLLLVILTLMLYVWVKEKKKRIYFDNIVQKASTPISKTNGKTSQSKFSNWSASPLELCCRVNSCILSFSLHLCPVSALLASECWGYCWEITANRFENKNDKENDQKRFGDRPHHGLSQESM